MDPADDNNHAICTASLSLLFEDNRVDPSAMDNDILYIKKRASGNRKIAQASGS